MASKYEIIVSAKLNEEESKSTLKKSFDKIAKDVDFCISNMRISDSAIENLKKQVLDALNGLNINVGVNPQTKGKSSGTSGTRTSTGSTSGTGIIPSGQFPEMYGVNIPPPDYMDAIRKRIEELKSAGAIPKVDIFSNFDEGAQKAEKVILTYQRDLDEITKETYVWKETQELVNGELKKTYGWVRDVQKDTKDVPKLVKQQEQEYNKLNLQADKFLSKIKLMKSTGDVLSGKNVASQLKEALASGNIERARELSDQLSVIDSRVRTTGKNSLSWAQSIGTALEKTIQWASAMTLLYGSIRQLEQGIAYVRELNKELTNIRIVTGMSKEEVSGLSWEFNKLAQELGATTTEVAQGSLEWFNNIGHYKFS